MSGGERGSTISDEWEAIERVLESTMRRHVLSYLDRLDREASLAELAVYLSGPPRYLACDTDADLTDSVDENSENSVAYRDAHARLKREHVPELLDAGLVVCDDEAEQIRLTDRARELPLFSPLNDKVVQTDGPAWLADTPSL
ncbi:DUF7344 domain-containing protein [Haloarchaeobius sp. DFWS5]|uniref:DUF7344 domain-containing protein n=1 Tax=Haloarchaeobius sp. DFWS5 TaxID=3446114 RepID=UPI003EB957FB